MLLSTLPVLQDGLLPRFDLLLPLLVVRQGVMRQGRSSITSTAKKTGVPPAEQGFGEYTVGSGCKAHPATGEGLDYSEHQNNMTAKCRGVEGQELWRGSPLRAGKAIATGSGWDEAALKPRGREKGALGTRTKPHWRQPTHLRCSFSLEPK